MIHRDAKRIKETGEVFTPAPLVNVILRRLPNWVWKKEKKFLDPACGNGNILVEVVAGKLKRGSSPWESLSTTFGVDLCADNVKECRQRLMEAAGVTDQKYMDLLKTTIVRGNTLEDSMEDLFSRFTARYGAQND